MNQDQFRGGAITRKLKSITLFEKGSKAMKAKIFFAALFLAGFCLASSGYSEVPQMINYHGQLTTPQGNLLDTTLSMTFAIYPDSLGAEPLWTETQDSVRVDRGVFSVLLGSINPLQETLFDGGLRYLGVAVGSDPEMTPRKQIASVGYAFRSERADTAEYALSGAGAHTSEECGWKREAGVPVVKLWNGGDNVGIGTSTPIDKLEVKGNSGITITSDDPWLRFLEEDVTDKNGQVVMSDGKLQLGFNDDTWENWSPKLTIQDDGKVGIGTESPSCDLDVSGDLRLSGKLFDGSGSEGVSEQVLTSTGTHVRWADATSISDGDWHIKDNDDMYSIPFGNVGIGTENPGAKLDISASEVDRELIVGDAFLPAISPQATEVSIGQSDATSSIYLGQDATGFGALSWNYNAIPAEANLTLSTSNNQDIAFMPGTGGVGIGTGDPRAKLDISASEQGAELCIGDPVGVLAATGPPTDVYIGQSDATSNIYLGQGATAYGKLSWSYDADPADAYLTLSTSNDQAIALMPGAGAVGIGTTTPDNSDPDRRLDVRGSLLAGTSDIDGVGISIKGNTIKPANIPGGHAEPFVADLHLDAMNTGSVKIAESGGKVSIGTTEQPENKLDVEGGMAVGAVYSGTHQAPADGMIIQGKVGVGTRTPQAKLDVRGTFRAGSPKGNYVFIERAKIGALSTFPVIGLDLHLDGGHLGDVILADNGGNVGIGTADTDAKLTIREEPGEPGERVVLLSGYCGDDLVVEIGKGLDYSETFPVAQGEITPGMVMVIDPVNKGHLTISTEAYDSKVAGIVAGAKGLGSGVRLGSRAGDSGDQAVALAGRVYCNVDTQYGNIQSGDLLTTSPTPGHAMVVRDFSKAQGAILGKAMEALSGGGKGQVLVLVSLQ